MTWTRILIATLAVVLLQRAPGMQAAATPLNGVSRLGNELSRPTMPTIRGQRTVPPLAFVKFCKRHAANCVVQAGSLPMRDGLVVASPRVLADLKAVNALVNTSMRKLSDKPGRDVWSVNVGAGDCEDFVLAKRARLLAKGWPSTGLSLAVVRTRAGNGHAVLVAHTDAGDFVLDNLQGEMHSLEQTDYQYISMQDGSRRLGWISL